MKVSELARRAGIRPSAIRFYEASGVIPAPPRTPAGYREYDEAALCRLQVLTGLRNLGIDLHEAGRLAARCSDGRCDEMRADLLPRLADRRGEIARARAELDHLEAALAAVEQAVRDGADTGFCDPPGDQPGRCEPCP